MMSKRIAALCLSLLMLLTLPAGSLAAGEEEGVELNAISFGTIDLSGRNESALQLKFSYGHQVGINPATLASLSETLKDAGFELSAEQLGLSGAMKKSASFLAVSAQDMTALRNFIEGERELYNGVSGSDFVSSLAALEDGFELFDGKSSLEASLYAAFPELRFSKAQPVELPYYLRDSRGVSMEEDSLSALVEVLPAPVEVEREVYGKIYTSTLISTTPDRYAVERCELNGASKGVVPTWEEGGEPSDSDTQPEAPTTTTTTTATTTTTTARDDETTTTAAKTTTTTAAKTTTTTAPEVSEPSDSDAGEESATGYVSTRRLPLRLRKGPGLRYAVIRLMPTGTELTILRHEGEWYYVRLADGTEGYAWEGYVSTK